MSESELTEDVFEEAADVVVVGSGAAGCTAALAAAHRGGRVLVLERADAVGGTTSLSSGEIWIPNNSLMRAKGVDDPRDGALRYLAKLAYPVLYDADDPTLGLPADLFALLEACYDEGPKAIDELLALDAIDVVADLEFPDYHDDIPENLRPYGRRLTARAASRPELGGVELIARMSAAAEREGARFLLGHRVVGLLRGAAGEVVGVEARTGRRTVLVRAHRAVVFASGGFLHDPDLRRQYLRGPVFGGCGATTATGDFVRIGIEAGAQLGNMGQAWWYQVALEQVVQTGQTAGGLFMPFGDSMIQVNRHGRRVTNEKAPYNERGPVHFAWDGREYCNLVLFAVYDDAVARNPDDTLLRYPTPMPGEAARYVISGDTFEELALAVDERLEELRHHTGGLRLSPRFAANLRRTVDRFNEFARTGVDEDFGRRDTPLTALWGGRMQEGVNNTMHPFSPDGPYHCILLVAGALDTRGGPRTNPRAQVLDTHDEPIPGLYGAGNCIASPAGEAYWGSGGTIGPAVTFGWIAGVNAVEEPEKVL
ncbi:MAG TPA: FAD-dependent oxidoreductase [Acidimicrobiales bacterium]|nr:FAD-dependent oxidoreductase [Acidimicrobiales bacterium]